jgi:hypothetical protein
MKWLLGVLLLLCMARPMLGQAKPLDDAYARALAEYDRTYLDFKKTANRLRLAETTAELKLLFRKLGMDTQAAESHALGFARVWPSVIDQLVTRLASEVDVTTKEPKGVARRQTELHRASLILAIDREAGRNAEPLAEELFAKRDQPMSTVLARWIAGEVKRREQLTSVP